MKMGMRLRARSAKVGIAQRCEPPLPDVYLPAMWPVELQQRMIDWLRAWHKRRLYRRLLRLDDRQLRMRDLNRPLLQEKARMPLRQLIAERQAVDFRACGR